MADPSSEMCEACKIGYHAPFGRFEEIAVKEDGPAFLMRCKNCGTLWYEKLYSAERLSAPEARRLFPRIEL